MNLQDLIIDVQPRAARGRQNKGLRKNKQVPAVVYGAKQKNIPLSLDTRQAEKYYRKAYDNKIFTFKSEDKGLNGLKVIRKDFAIDKIKRNPIHIDFLALDMNAVIRVNLELKFQGVPKGVKEEGGIFNITLRTVEIECLPDKIPASLDVDVSDLGLNEAIHASDLKMSSDLKLITKLERTLCTVVAAAEEEEATTTEEATTPEAGAAPAASATEGAAAPADDDKKAEAAAAPSKDKKD